MSNSESTNTLSLKYSEVPLPNLHSSR